LRQLSTSIGMQMLDSNIVKAKTLNQLYLFSHLTPVLRLWHTSFQLWGQILWHGWLFSPHIREKLLHDALVTICTICEGHFIQQLLMEGKKLLELLIFTILYFKVFHQMYYNDTLK